MADDSLKKLYEWFDRLYDLPPELQQKQLDELRSSGDSMVLELEGLLTQSRNEDATEMPFSLNEILDACDDQGSMRLATDLRELSSKMVWDSKLGGFRISNFVLRRSLSVSALGATYLAYDETLDRDVVILLAYPRWGSNPAVKKRMLESARAVAKIANPHVAAILGTMDLGGQVAILRQWIPGTSLATAIGKRESLDLRAMCELGSGIAHGLQAIHDERVIHGDLKPSNIILRGERWHPVITDFGTATWIAADGGSSWQGGTAGFIAPEILGGKAPTVQSDLYSLGVILYWIATGLYRDSVRGEAGESSWPTTKAFGGNTSDRRSTSQFMNLVDRLQSEDPSQRPLNAAEVVEALDVCGMESQSLKGAVSTFFPVDETPSSLDGWGNSTLFRRSVRRRAFMAHALGLTATAAASMWGGDQLARRWMSPGMVMDVTVPGWESDYSLLVAADRERFAEEPADSYLISPIDLRGYSNECIGPRKTNKWMAIYSRPVVLPNHGFDFSLLNVSVEFNCAPKQSEYVFESKLVSEKTWTQLTSARNHFGGLHWRAVEAYVPPTQLNKEEPIIFRMRLRTRGPSLKQGLLAVAAQIASLQGERFIALNLWRKKGVS